MRLGLPLLASVLALGAVAKKNKKPNENHIPVDVKIAHTEGTQITVTITNKWKKDVNLFKRMSILDPNPVEKLNITGPNGMLWLLYTRYCKPNILTLSRRTSSIHRSARENSKGEPEPEILRRSQKIQIRERDV
jgi:hypothetical protein